MFLTLVLGLYLGSLMPGALHKPDRPATVVIPSASGQEIIDAAPNQELERMIAELEKKAAANPQSAPDWINLGNIYFDAMRPALAIKAYEHALALAPDNADVLTDLGIMYRETGQFEKAVDSFRKAIEINPGHENAMFNQGVVLATDLKRNAEAAAIWKKLLDINPQARAPDGKYLKDLVGNLE
ncbi:MAG: tetratricopeptide repeat protein [Desulfovibrio sp.]|nr:tetratricopeptide repeat protein [Desulfovibrio sp.]